MAAHRPFRPLGDLQLQRFAAALKRAHEQWHASWFEGDPGVFEVDCRAAAAMYSRADGWRSVATAAGCVWLRLSEADGVDVVGAWVGAGVDERWRQGGDDASVLLVRRVLGDWLDTLAGAPAPLAQSWEARPPANELFDPFSGAVHASFRTWFGQFDGVFDGDFVARTQPAFVAPAGRDPRRVPRRQAIGGATLKLQVSAEAAAGLTIGTLRTLAVGDVLLLQPAISEPWTLTTRAGQPIASCFIGRQGQHCAALISARKEPQDGR